MVVRGGKLRLGQLGEGGGWIKQLGWGGCLGLDGHKPDMAQTACQPMFVRALHAFSLVAVLLVGLGFCWEAI